MKIHRLVTLLVVTAVTSLTAVFPAAAGSTASAAPVIELPNGGGGPACPRDYYATGNTTKVKDATFTKDKRPVVYVHGWTGSPQQWTSTNPSDAGTPKNPASYLESQTNGRIQSFLYDYSVDSIRWANNDRIAACLGQYISEIGESWKKVGGDGKVITIAHSMGGMAILYSAGSQFAQYPSTDYLGGIITLDTPYLGSYWGGLGIPQLKEAVHAAVNLQLLPSLTSDAGVCLSPHSKGKPPCKQPLPPVMSPAVPITAIQGDISVDRKILGLKLYSMDLGGDGIVSSRSQAGYADMYIDHPEGAEIDTSKVDGCSISTGELIQAASNGLPGIGTSALISIYNLGSDAFSGLIRIGEDEVNAQDKAADINQVFTTIKAIVVAPCSHTNILKDQSALNQATEALKSYLDRLDAATAASSGKLAADSPYRLGIGDQAGFTTPSGNIACLMDPAEMQPYPAVFSTVCYVKDHTWQSDPRPDTSTCSESWSWAKDYVALMKEGVSAGICTGDSPTYSSKTVLPYGQSITTGPITCSSSESGVTCADSRLGTGFTVSRSTFTRNGSSPTWSLSTSGAEGYSAFEGTWQRHTSELDINPDKTGSVLYGSGCCNSIKVPVPYEMDGDGKTLIGTVSGDAAYMGDSFRDTKLPAGTKLRFHIEESEPYGGKPTGPVVVQDNPFNSSDLQSVVWCNTAYDGRCGA